MVVYANYLIDTVQAVKSNALKTMVTDTKVRDPLQAIIEAQTAFAKNTVKAIGDLTTYAQSTVEKYTGK